jgi:hypothetical protein
VNYAYIHCKPDGTPFYVGKGKLRRAKYLGERNPYHRVVVQKYGASSILIGMLECSSEKIAYSLEEGLIKCLRRSKIQLCNFTSGGDGGRNPTLETRKRLSEAAKKRGVSNACHVARVLAKTGKPLSGAQKLLQSKSMRGKVFTEEHRKNISIAAKKRGMPQSVLDAAHKASRGRIPSLEERQKRGAAIRVVKQKIKAQKNAV